MTKLSYSTYRLVDTRASYEIDDPGLNSAVNEAAGHVLARLTSQLFDSTGTATADTFSSTASNNEAGNLTLAYLEHAYETIREPRCIYYFVSRLLPAIGIENGQPILFRQDCDGKKVWLMHPDRFAEFEAVIKAVDLEPVEYDYREFCKRQVEQSIEANLAKIKRNPVEWLNRQTFKFCRP